MFAGIAAAGVIAIAGGGYFAIQAGKANAGSVAPQGDTAQKLSHPVAGAAPQVVNLPRAFESITPLVDDSASARVALDSLAQLEPSAQSDSDVVHLRYLRGRALLTLNDTKQGCASLTSIEGKSGNTRFKRAVGALLVQCK